MDKFIINGGVPLKGEISPSGNKNSALPILAACTLSKEPITLKNIPNIRDVQAMRELLQNLGVQVKNIDDHTWMIHAQDVSSSILDPELCKQIRASILLAGPVVARTGKLILPPPGGDVIGRRRVDTHILALRALGITTEYDRIKKVFRFQKEVLQGNNFILDEASVTATENAIMAAVTARGETVIRNAASEPHVQELCQFLNILGANIKNIGSNTLKICGVWELSGGEFEIGPDYLEVVSFIGAAVVTHGSIRIKNAAPEYLDMIEIVFRRLGVRWEIDNGDIYVPNDQELIVKPDLGDAIPEISVMPWPSFPTDLMSIAIVVATQSKGSVLFHDWMYPSRMFFLDKLVNMGAQIVLCDPHRCIVNGPTTLYAEKLDSPDIRAGMTLVLAALTADGESIIRNVGQIDRGYESVDEKLRMLGARIVRIKEN
jgi:UDP-N-acetylglucosamine 1-carboxyvinyltransferase